MVPTIRSRTARAASITSQNHGYVIDEASLPDDVVITHRNLHDNTLEGFEVPSKKIMCVQYHPEASPGPTDNLHLSYTIRQDDGGKLT